MAGHNQEEIFAVADGLDELEVKSIESHVKIADPIARRIMAESIVSIRQSAAILDAHIMRGGRRISLPAHGRLRSARHGLMSLLKSAGIMAEIDQLPDLMGSPQESEDDPPDAKS